MKVYVVILHTNSVDYDSGTVDEFTDIVKVFSTPNKANDFLEGKPKSSSGPFSKWFTIESYEVIE
jgi:hypothetical protein